LVVTVPTNRSRWWRGVVICFLCATVCHAERYSFKHYLQDSGLTNLAVNTINQDKDGFLWVATDNGLFRHNGRVFQRFGREDGLPQDDVTTLTVSAAGTIWAGTPVGVSYMSGGRFHAVQLGPGLDKWPPGGLAAADGNTTYASTGQGLMKLTLEGSKVSVQKVYSGETFAVVVQAGGTVWFGCGRDLCRLQGQETVRVGAQLGLPHERWESAISDARGALWVRSTRHLYELPSNASTFVERGKGLPTSAGQVTELRADPIYGVAVPTREGLAIPHGEGWRIIGERNGLASDAVATAFRDREGSMWIGLRGSGVDRWLGEGQWENWTKAEGLSADMLWGLTKDPNGRIWVGTTHGISGVDPSDGRVQMWKGGQQSKRDWASVVEADPTGRVWVAGSSGGLARFDPSTLRLQKFGKKDGIGLDTVGRILLDAENTLWVLGGGVYRSSSVLRDPVTFTRQSIPSEAPRQNYASGAFDGDGCVWITSDNGLFRYASGRWYRYDEKDGLKSAAVGPIAISNGSVWIAYRSPFGITRISEPDGHWSVTDFSTHTGLPSDMIYAMGAGGASVWAGTDSGVLQFRGSEWKRYSQMDGMVWDDCDTNGILADGGAVWIGTSRGLSHFTPDKWVTKGSQDLRAPFLRYVDQTKRVRSGNELVLPWSSRNFSIAWDSVNYREEGKISYQFRIDGAESPWTSTTEMATSFSNLPAGPYRFEVRAVGHKGVKSSAALMTFRIAAPWWQTAPFRLGVGVIIIGLFVLTWRAQSARLLRDKRKLEIAVAVRTRELAEEKSRAEAERERAESASRHKGEFLANMSHEIRTPMNGIIGMTDLLLATSLDSEQLECAQTVRQCGEHLLSVINDILDFSKIEAGRIQLETAPFDLRAVMSLVADLASPLVRVKGLSLGVEYDESLPSYFEGDAGRVRQIAMNFVSNAIKFTETGAIWIKVRPPAVLAGQEAIRIEITDSGCGIPSSKIGSLFQQFVQADASTTRRYGGTGLGLAISKKLAEMMGGSVGVLSDVGKGSTFWAEIQLPPAKAQPEREKPKQLSVAPLERPLRVLVAEDNLVNQKLLTRILQRLGCQFEIAHNGAEAVELYSKTPFEVVLMDCQMPICDGYEATAAIRELEKEKRNARVPIVALTAHAAGVDRDRCFAAGMDVYLTKPISVERLREVLSGIAGDTTLDRSLFEMSKRVR
jgi:signal transduction histidine kinase/CheY-like chemotaxis protein/streptogramin lyase